MIFSLIITITSITTITETTTTITTTTISPSTMAITTSITMTAINYWWDFRRFCRSVMAPVLTKRNCGWIFPWRQWLLWWHCCFQPIQCSGQLWVICRCNNRHWCTVTTLSPHDVVQHSSCFPNCLSNLWWHTKRPIQPPLSSQCWRNTQPFCW